MSEPVAMRKRVHVAACLTCPICDKIYREATTISLCLHTFCRRCIYERFTDSEDDSCPVCNMYLGSTPEDKLRPDRAMQDIQAKIFPRRIRRRRRGEDSQSAQSRPPPSARREDNAEMRPHNPTTIEEVPYQMPDEDLEMMDDNVKEMSCPESSFQTVSIMKPSSSHPSPSEAAVDEITDFWQPLNCLVEAAFNSRPLKLIARRKPEAKKKVEAVSEDLPDFPPLVVDSMRHDRSIMPIWFSLVASEEEEESARLPQLPSRFLKVKNGSMPVSGIQQYIAMKFQLSKEDEVKIKFQGETLPPSLVLREALDNWTKSGHPSRFMKAMVGDSAEEVVMPLTYSRKQLIVQVEVEALVPPPPEINND